MKTKPKPRLSMKLLWQFEKDFWRVRKGQEFETTFEVEAFLKFVEEQMKPLKP